MVLLQDRHFICSIVDRTMKANWCHTIIARADIFCKITCTYDTQIVIRICNYVYYNLVKKKAL